MAVKLTEQALEILKARYLRKDHRGNVVEEPEDMFRRVAGHVAGAERFFDKGTDAQEWALRFEEMMASLDFLPNSPTLMNAGRKLGQLAACFVLPVEDSLESIFDAVKNTALIHQSGGGTGFSFSHLRPRNDLVSTTSGVASGPVSFMQVFNKATDVIKQGGTRRGANMGVLRVDHPDIREFITIKRDRRELTSFNLSVGINDVFMCAVERDGKFELVSPRTRAVIERIAARDLFDLIIECSWDSGEPGVVFLDEINRHNPTPQLGTIEATNPCGEQPLLPFESCNLGSINLAHMVRKTTSGYTADWEKLKETVRVAVRFLDNVVEINRYPLAQIREVSRGNRKIGLGVMGFAHYLLLIGVSYRSDEGLRVGEEVMRVVNETARDMSRTLAKERGPFPNFRGSLYDRVGDPPLRNATLTTIAPTGTLSIIAGCSSGIEPLYALAYTRRALDSFEYTEVDPLLIGVARTRGLWSQDLDAYVRTTGFLPRDSVVPQEMRDLFVTAFDISPSHHIRMQAAFQAHTGNAVSKTINFSHEACKEDVEEALWLAYRLKCKGLTVYRSGTRGDQVLTCGGSQIC